MSMGLHRAPARFSGAWHISGCAGLDRAQLAGRRGCQPGWGDAGAVVCGGRNSQCAGQVRRVWPELVWPTSERSSVDTDQGYSSEPTWPWSHRLPWPPAPAPVPPLLVWSPSVSALVASPTSLGGRASSVPAATRFSLDARRGARRPSATSSRFSGTLATTYQRDESIFVAPISASAGGAR